jgi:prevent-host-death family protein
MEKTVGIRRLRDRLTLYLGSVRRGGRVVITDRGRPIALLLPYPEDEDSASRDRLRAVLAGGHILPAEKRFLAHPPLIKGQGSLPSDLISEGRR